ncbi:MAG: hypothetical protein HS111_11440 [Kofleriaceae bacterium]|nr:hypothetical protein [Kofleriaceae bacterium]
MRRLDGACALADLRPRNPIGADDLHLLLLRRAQIDVRLHQLAQQLVPLGADEALDPLSVILIASGLVRRSP